MTDHPHRRDGDPGAAAMPSLVGEPQRTELIRERSASPAALAIDGQTLTGDATHTRDARSPSDSPMSARKALPDDLLTCFDATIVDAFGRSPKDKAMLLRADAEMERFMLDATLSRLPIQPPHFAPINSFQRLLIHRLADSYQLLRVLDAFVATSPVGLSVLVLQKTPTSRIPDVRLGDLELHLAGLTSPSIRSVSKSPALTEPGSTPADVTAAASVFRIMTRQTDPSRPTSSASADDSKQIRRALTLEEREAAYQEARQRIFASSASEADAERAGGLDILATASCPETPLMRPKALRPSAPAFDPATFAPVASTSRVPIETPTELDLAAAAAASSAPLSAVVDGQGTAWRLDDHGRMPASPFSRGHHRSGSRSPSSASASTVASSAASASTSSSVSDPAVSRKSRGDAAHRISPHQPVMRFGPTTTTTTAAVASSVSGSAPPLFPPSHAHRPSSPTMSTASMSTSSSRRSAGGGGTSSSSTPAVHLGPGLPDLEPMAAKRTARSPRQPLRPRTPSPPPPSKLMHPSLPKKPDWIDRSKHEASDPTHRPGPSSFQPSLSTRTELPGLAAAANGVPLSPVVVNTMLPPSSTASLAAMPPDPRLYPPGFYSTAAYPPSLYAPLPHLGMMMPPAAPAPAPPPPPPLPPPGYVAVGPDGRPLWDPYLAALYQHQLESMMGHLQLPTSNGDTPVIHLDEDAPRAARPPSMALFDPNDETAAAAVRPNGQMRQSDDRPTKLTAAFHVEFMSFQSVHAALEPDQQLRAAGHIAFVPRTTAAPPSSGSRHLSAAAAPFTPGRILFGIVDEREVNEMMQDGMATGGVSLSFPSPASSAVKWDPTPRAALNLTQPPNFIQSLRPGIVRKVSRSSEQPSPPASVPVYSQPLPPSGPPPPPGPPVASTSRPASTPPTKPAEDSDDGMPFGAPIELGQTTALSRQTAALPAAALSFKKEQASLTISRPTQSPSPAPQTSTNASPMPSPGLMPRPSQPTLSGGVLFSRALRPPASVPNIVQVDERPPKPARKAKVSVAPAAAASSSPSDTPLASSDAALSTAPTSPQLPSSPPTRTTSPKPALKPKSWADLLRSPSTTPVRKRVSIALPPSDDDTTTSPSSSAVSSPTRPSLSLSQRIMSAVPLTASLPVQPSMPLPMAPPLTNAHASVVFPPEVLPVSSGVSVQQNAAAPAKRKLEDVLRGVEDRLRAPPIQPRGLVNKGNQCFENSILQILVFCGPFYNLLRLLGQETTYDFSGRFPCLEAMVSFADDFNVGRHDHNLLHAVSAGLHKPTIADAFAPEVVYDALRGNKRFEVMMRGSQEDAQEFLGFLLDTLHEELLALIDLYDGAPDRSLANGTASAPTNAHADPSDGWLEVGSKGRTATTRSTGEGRESPVTRIFAGKQRSTLRVPGQKDSATVEPFLTLQLDIAPDSVETVEDAIANLCTIDTISDYSARPGVRIDASKQVTLEALPPVLVLHLKRFSYDGEVRSTIKNHKVIGFETELNISPAWLSPVARSSSVPCRYTLSGVVYHHGRNATGGHYTVSLRKQDGQWINIDDTTVIDVGPADVSCDRTSEVLRLSLPSANDGIPERAAYLLIFTRASA